MISPTYSFYETLYTCDAQLQVFYVPECIACGKRAIRGQEHGSSDLRFCSPLLQTQAKTDPSSKPHGYSEEPRGSPKHSPESHNGRVVYISCSCCKHHLHFCGRHLGNHGLPSATNSVSDSRVPTFHFTRKARAESRERSSPRAFRVRTSSGPTGIARLQGLALDEGVWGGGKHGEQSCTWRRSRPRWEDIYIRRPPCEKRRDRVPTPRRL